MNQLRKVIGSWWWWARVRLVLWLMPLESCGACGNRYWRKARIGHYVFTLGCRDASEPDAYAREDCYQMLKLVRRHAPGLPEPVGDDQPVLGRIEVF